VNNKLKIIETPDYVLAVSDEEIKEGDLCVYNKNHNSRNPNWELIRCGVIEREEMHPHSNNKLLLWMKKIIAYQPKGNASELDLPLLPEIVIEDDVEKFCWRLFGGSFEARGVESEEEADKTVAFGIECYKAATKVYSEDDLRKYTSILDDIQEDLADYQNEVGIGILDDNQWKQLFIERIIASVTSYEELPLKQPTPKWFVAEMEYDLNSPIVRVVDDYYIVMAQSENDFKSKELKIKRGDTIGFYTIETAPKKLKTTTINGETYLIGKYE
jgi:hypothetical protein